MKQRIIATILLIVTVLTMFAGCANYAFLDDETFGANCVEVDYNELLNALKSIKIAEEDFGPTEDREEIVKREIYNTILTSLNNDESNKLTEGTIGEYDMVEYYYYSTVTVNGVDYIFNSNMKTPVNTLTTSSTTKTDKAVKEGIVAGLAAANWTLVKDEPAYEVTTSLTNKRIAEDDTIVVSYSLKTEKFDADQKVETTTYYDYTNVEMTKGDFLFDTIREYFGGIGSFSIDGGVKEDKKESDGVLKTYTSVSVSYINPAVDADQEFVYVQTLEADMNNTTAYRVYDDSNTTVNEKNLKVTIDIPEGAEVTYHVYPVAYIAAPVNTAKGIVKHILNDDIAVTSLDRVVDGETVSGIFHSEVYKNGEKTLKALVEELVAVYANNDDAYESDTHVVDALKELNDERTLARRQAIYTAVKGLTTIYNKDGKDGKSAANYILEKYEEKTGTEVADIHALFAILSDNGEHTVTWSALRDFIGTPFLDLLGYRYESDGDSAGQSAVAVINAINEEYDKVNEKDEDGEVIGLAAYDSYKNTTPDIYVIDEEGNVTETKVKTINVVEKKNKYEDAKKQAKLDAAELLIDQIVACTDESGASVESKIVGEYEQTLEGKAYMTLTPYDLIKYALLTESTTISTFGFIEKLSDYEYGNRVENKGLFAKEEEPTKAESVLADLVAVYTGSDTSAYDYVEAVKTAKDTYNTAKETFDKNAVALYKALDEKDKDIVSTTYAAVLKLMYLYLDSFKNGDETAFAGLVKAYIAANTDTLFVLKADKKTNSKQTVLDTDSARSTFLKEVLSSEFAFDFSAYTKDGAAVDATLWTALSDLHKENDAVEAANEAYEAEYAKAKEEAIDDAIAAFLSVSLKDEDGNKVANLSTELSVRYYNNTINGKISTYNSNIQNKLSKEVYNIINNDKYVTIKDEAAYEEMVAKLLKEFVDTIYANYEYEYYTGTSEITSEGTAADGVSKELRDEYNKYTEQLAEANAALTSAGTGTSAGYTNYISTIATIVASTNAAVINGAKDKNVAYVALSDLDLSALTEAEQAYYTAYHAYLVAYQNYTDKNNEIKELQKDLTELEKSLTLNKGSFFDRIVNWFLIKVEISKTNREINKLQKEIDKNKTGLKAVYDNAQKALNGDSTADTEKKYDEYLGAKGYFFLGIDGDYATWSVTTVKKNTVGVELKGDKLDELVEAIKLELEAANEEYKEAYKAYEPLKKLEDKVQTRKDAVETAEREIAYLKWKIEKGNATKTDENRLTVANEELETKKSNLETAEKNLQEYIEKTWTDAETRAADIQAVKDRYAAAAANHITGAANEYNTAKTALNTAKSTYETHYEKLLSWETAVANAQTAYDEAKAEDDNAADADKETTGAALNDAENALNAAKKDLADYKIEKKLASDITAESILADYQEKAEDAKAKLDNYYKVAHKVEVVANYYVDEATGKLEDELDSKGNVVKEGLKTQLANAEKEEAGKTLSNLEAYATFEAFLEAKLGENYEATIKAEARAMIDEQIRIYAVAKVLVDNGAIEAYKAAINTEVEGEKLFYNILRHSVEHNHEDWSTKKLDNEAEDQFEELLESADDLFVSKKVYNDYKKELGNAQYTYMKNQYGDNNLRMSLQFSNLLNYLLFANYEENPYAAHDGEYMLKIDGEYLDYFFIEYTFESEE